MRTGPSHPRRMRALIAAALATLSLGAAACGPSGPTVIVQPSPAPPASPSEAPLSPAVPGLECTEVQTIAPYEPASQDAQHVPDGQAPALTSYTSSPPASGPHAGTTMPAGVYTEPVPWENVIHSMEHGAAVIWYDPAAEPARIAAVKTIVDSSPEHTIMAPFSYPDESVAGALPEGTEMALVAWRRLQTCNLLDPATVRAFLGAYRTPPLDGGAYLGEAPEPGVPI